MIFPKGLFETLDDYAKYVSHLEYLTRDLQVFKRLMIEANEANDLTEEACDRMIRIENFTTSLAMLDADYGKARGMLMLTNFLEDCIIKGLCHKISNMKNSGGIKMNQEFLKLADVWNLKRRNFEQRFGVGMHIPITRFSQALNFFCSDQSSPNYDFLAELEDDITRLCKRQIALTRSEIALRVIMEFWLCTQDILDSAYELLEKNS